MPREIREVRRHNAQEFKAGDRVMWESNAADAGTVEEIGHDMASGLSKTVSVRWDDGDLGVYDLAEAWHGFAHIKAAR